MKKNISLIILICTFFSCGLFSSCVSTNPFDYIDEIGDDMQWQIAALNYSLTLEETVDDATMDQLLSMLDDLAQEMGRMIEHKKGHMLYKEALYQCAKTSNYAAEYLVWFNNVKVQVSSFQKLPSHGNTEQWSVKEVNTGINFIFSINMSTCTYELTLPESEGEEYARRMLNY